VRYAGNGLGFNLRRSLLSATSLATTLLFLVPGVADAQSTTQDWSGPYIGASLGALLGTDTLNFTYTSAGGAPAKLDVPVLGPSGTIALGYNVQSGTFVYGIEADGSFIAGSGTLSPNASSTVTSKLDSLLSLRGRLGLTNGNLLTYATAGIAAGHGGFDAHLNYGGGSITDATAAGLIFGPIAGVGTELALNDKVSLTAEGTVASLGSLTATGDNGKGSYTANSRQTAIQLKSGVNFHF
jgi:outer membrane immunogenic protein